MKSPFHITPQAFPEVARIVVAGAIEEMAQVASVAPAVIWDAMVANPDCAVARRFRALVVIGLGAVDQFVVG